MKTKNIIALFITVIVFVQAQLTSAQTAEKLLVGWELLGTREVDYTLDHDAISLKEGSHSITGLKFIVKNGSTLNMHKATVHFANGDVQDIEFPAEVNKSNDGRIVELKGNSRKIEKITFWYDTVNKAKEKSVVEVWGK
jgi:hypothetical protein